MKLREQLRNIAIIAHVDHGKTTLVDAMFRQGGVFRANQRVVDRAMDNNAQERERGITILAKTTSVAFTKEFIGGDEDILLQIVDTPGHADFGGEVERTLLMVDGVLLLVDAAEGPLPQTRFVLRKALGLGLAIIVVINKIDRGDARPAQVLDEIYDLFIDLGADDRQIDFPVLYAISREGTASRDLAVPGVDLRPLVQAVIDTVPAPVDRSDEPFAMRVNTIGYDEYVGRLIIGRIDTGVLKTNDDILLLREDGQKRARATGIFNFLGLERIGLDVARSGDIVAISGIEDVSIGDTVCSPQQPRALTRIRVDEPTVGMVFQVNDGPFAGRSGGRFVTSREIRDRLRREAFANVSIRIEDTGEAEQMRVLGRGELQLSVLIESMRREGYELCVRNPEVVTRQAGDHREEPIERLVVDVAAEHVGAVTEIVGRRRGTLLDQRQEGSRIRLEYIIPTRGLFGMRGQLLTATRGTAIATSVFEGWTPWMGDIPQRQSGALVADRRGEATAYALFNLQPRGILFTPAGTTVYEGMVVGEHSRGNDLNVNATREKKLTNIRTHAKDEALVIVPPRQMTLELSLEWIRDDEMVEVTPQAIRIRKRTLAANQR